MSSMRARLIEARKSLPRLHKSHFTVTSSQVTSSQVASSQVTSLPSSHGDGSKYPGSEVSEVSRRVSSSCIGSALLGLAAWATLIAHEVVVVTSRMAA